jgi:hypothetical protein
MSSFFIHVMQKEDTVLVSGRFGEESGRELAADLVLSLDA